MQNLSMLMEDYLPGKRIHTHLVYERLDRSIVRKDWASIYPDAFELNGSFTCSDHCLIILSTSGLREPCKAFSFRFQNCWSMFQQAGIIFRKK